MSAHPYSREVESQVRAGSRSQPGVNGLPAESDWSGLPPRTNALDEVRSERARQDAKWGEQNHPDGTRDDRRLLRDVSLPTYGTLAYRQKLVVDGAAENGSLTYAEILLEEVFEALCEHDPARVRAELIQAAAVAVAWVEAIDRRTDGGAS